ncbi:MAG: chorismate synthase [Syntrophomonadaceae bacterium]|nr:chorismate synthase [Syntrophomonadaceae bacterium]
MLKFTTSGESHGKGLITIIEGLPSGLPVDEEYINRELARRQKGYGRGGRMQIESDKVEIFAGVRNGKTLGSPISFLIRNQDYENWQDIMNSGTCPRIDERVLTRPRPGHADLPGAMKYHHRDMRNVLERASARETASRVAAGAFFKLFLKQFGILMYSYVRSIGSVNTGTVTIAKDNLEEFGAVVEESPLRCPDKGSEGEMIKLIEQAKSEGESLGGSFEVGALGVCPGLGSHISWERKLDGQMAAALMSIPAIKAVEIGEGIANAGEFGSRVHDQIRYQEEPGLYRNSNRAGGIEGGISNGETIYVRAYMKPIPTLYKPLISVNTANWKEEKAQVERSDVCAVPAAAVVGEAMLAYVLARAFRDQFGGESMDQVEQACSSYREYLGKVWKWKRI